MEGAEVEAPFMGDVGVGVECNVRYRVAVRDEEFAVLQVPLHDSQGGVPEPPLGLERHAALLTGQIQSPDDSEEDDC